MKKILFTCAMLFLGSQLSGCVLFHGYAPAIQQGNVIVPAQVNQIHNGMSKDQVQAIMGSPVYITTFSDSRYDYVYTYQKPCLGKRYQQNVIISFSGGGVSNIQKNLPALPSRYHKWF